ncbi:MAG: hypothetical protein IK134_10220 [Oscillospiraceae bacterium]|nr:hypothetical protein [Oscillospiraceae bacterium]
MNAENFMDLLNTLPDDMIVSAVHAEYQRRTLPVWLMPAAAACLIIGIAVAVYPKLRMQKPPVAEPVISVTETTVAQMTTNIQTQTDAPETKTTAQTANTMTQAATDSRTSAVTEPVTQPAETEMPKTEPVTQPTTPEPHTETVPPVVTTVPDNQDATEPESTHTEHQVEMVEAVQVWQGEMTRPEMASDPESEPQIRCIFSIFNRSEPDMDMNMIDDIKNQYGIPENYDLTKNQCLLIRLETEYADTAVTGGTLTADGLVLYVACRNQKEPLTDIYCAAPLPEGITVEPENCRAEYQIYENESEKPKVKNPLIQINV